MSRKGFSTANYLRISSAGATATPMTLVGWIKVSVLPATGSMVLDVHHSGSASNFNCFHVYLNTDGTAVARTGASGSSSTSVTTAATSPNRWAHVGGVFTSATSRTAYLDGIAGTTNTTSKVPGSTVNQTYAGVQGGSSIANALDPDAQLAHVAHWNVALTAGEMYALANGVRPSEIRRHNLVGYWPLDGTSDIEWDYYRSLDLRLRAVGTVGVGEEPPLLPVNPRRRVYFGVTAAAAGATTTALLSAGVGAMGAGITKAILPAGVGHMG